MRRQIEYHLAQARAAAPAPPPARAAVRGVGRRPRRTLQRLHAERGVAIDVAIPPEHAVRGQREDLDEMLGNLLDNACKWATSRVIVALERRRGPIVDHRRRRRPGAGAAMRDTVLRARRARRRGGARLGPRAGDRARPGGALRRLDRARHAPRAACAPPKTARPAAC